MEIAKKRKSIPLATQLEVALRQLAKSMGVDASALELNHNPACNFRPWNASKTDTIPPANDAAALEWIASDVHKVQTFGPGGERRIHTRGSDVSEPRRLDRINARHVEFRAKVLSVAKTRMPRKRSWPKRGFAKKGKSK